MCGIVGQWRLDGASVQPRNLKRMNETLIHRGPDDQGYVLFKKDGLKPFFSHHLKGSIDDGPFAAGFGHRRLSILDLSIKGRQPMASEDGTLWITYNGEIYNYIEIRRELEEYGFRFSTGTDTEVILNAYRKWGSACLHRFNGMFAFALFDLEKRLIFCARDRFGIKPFYYFFDGKVFVFASEIKSIFESGLVESEPNYPIIGVFLKYHLTDFGTETFFRNIFQILPHHYLLLSPDGLRTGSYWDIDPDEVTNGSLQDAAVGFRENLIQSVKLRLRSDVQVASCLSGGMDSSSIVCIANKELRHGLKAFSVVYEGQMPLSEKNYIDRVREETGTEGFFTQPTAEDVLEILPRMIWHLDEPISSIGAVASQYFVQKLIKENGIKVVLDGQGGDEILGGYHLYFFFHLLSLLQSGHPISMFRELHSIRSNSTWKRPFSSYLKNFMIFTLRPSVGTFTKYKDRSFFSPEFSEIYEDKIDDLVFSGRTRKFNNTLQETLYHDTLWLRLPHLLRYEDRTAMAHSVEARVPFLDFNLVEFAFSLPPNHKIANGRTKVVLKEAMKQIVPQEVIDRKDKMGYNNPQPIWFRRAWADLVEEVLFSGGAERRGIWRVERGREMFERHKMGHRDFSVNLSELLTLEIWMRTFVDKRGL